MKLVLHSYWRSSASHRVRIGLGLKELAYEYVAVDIRDGAQTADAYRAKNPMMQVPTLEITEDDGRVHAIAQSLPILEFLDDRFGGTPLLPIDPYECARARSLVEIINSGVQPFQNLPTLKRVKALGGDEQAFARDYIAAGLAAFAALAADTKFSAGDAPTIADCCLVPQLAAARRFHVDLAQLAKLLAIEERCLALPAFQRAAPDVQPDAIRAS